MPHCSVLGKRHLSNSAAFPRPTGITGSSSGEPNKAESLPVLTDLFGRFHNYLRISITERCNLRCQYCMPEEGIDLTPNERLLTTPEIIRVARIFVSQGVDKIRLTGGEPTVRKDIVDLVKGLDELRPLGLRKIAMTTNGIALRRKLPLLRQAGMDGLNVSLDTRDPRKFELMTRRKGCEHVLRAVADAGKLGFDFVKLNVVVMRGQNDEEVSNFVEMTHDDDIDVRFIEYMPFDGNRWGKRKMVGYRELLDRLASTYGAENIQTLPLESNHTAKGYRINGYKGKFGFITSMTHSFCSSCNRVRIMADGNLKVCLFGNTEVSLRDLLRAGCSDEEIIQTIGSAVKRKKQAHAGLNILSQMPNRPMIKIDEEGNAHMVDVSAKQPTLRTAIARGRVLMHRETYDLIKADKIKKGNVLTVAQVAGIQGAKACSQIIPLCHPINLTKVSVDLGLDGNANALPFECAVNIKATVKCKGETGVEMEALSAVSVAALTVFDMCKAVTKEMTIDGIKVVEKTGGKSGHWKQE
ncbi:hypothetical protein EV177_002438 [Coemansia sp. RSA 1804]|nr:hypothetical protein EV177_002438 [Coemansia sp. RSA 1804]